MRVKEVKNAQSRPRSPALGKSLTFPALQHPHLKLGIIIVPISWVYDGYVQCLEEFVLYN